MAKEFKKEKFLGVPIRSFYSGDGDGGLNVSYWKESVILKFWSKDKNKNDQNASFFVPNAQMTILNGILTNIGMGRMEAEAAGKPYPVIGEVPLELGYMKDGKFLSTGKIVVSSVPFGTEGKTYIQITAYYGDTSWHTVFYDALLIESLKGFKGTVTYKHDPYDMPFMALNFSLTNALQQTFTYQCINKLWQSTTGGSKGGYESNGPRLIEGSGSNSSGGDITF